jgi:hypothetical protein
MGEWKTQLSLRVSEEFLPSLKRSLRRNAVSQVRWDVNFLIGHSSSFKPLEP